jgi:hypothetical protein
LKKFTINANNGCLGDFDRGKTQTAAILVGEVPSTFDPAVSEWGNLLVSDKWPYVKLIPQGVILVYGWVRRELKHLSNARNINHMRFC